MKRKFSVLILFIFISILSACSFNFNFGSSKITTETLNHISTVIMNANVKITTSTYKIEFFQKIDGPHRGFGSGVIIDKEEVGMYTYYYVLTNFHVIHLDDNYSHEYEIEDIYNNVISADLIAKSEEFDLAVLKFKAESELLVIDLADENPDIYDTVFSVGSPSGKHNIITAGKIVGYTKIKNVGYDVIVHEAFIHKGSSGSMLINDKYELIGLNTWGFVQEDEKLDENFVKGGATPIEKIIEFLEMKDVNKTK